MKENDFFLPPKKKNGDVVLFMFLFFLLLPGFSIAQYKAQFMIPSSGMICTNDLVEPYELGLS